MIARDCYNEKLDFTVSSFQLSYVLLTRGSKT